LAGKIGPFAVILPFSGTPPPQYCRRILQKIQGARVIRPRLPAP
jgi:hypothetical protein